MSELSDAVKLVQQGLLQRLAGPAGTRSMLLLDTSLRPVDAEDSGWQHCATLPHLPVPVLHERIEPSNFPTLVTFKPDVQADAEFAKHTLNEAWEELKPRALRQGRGRRIGGWISTTAPAEEVARHLGQLMLQTDPNGRTRWLRLHDPAVLWILWGWLYPAQRTALLGPIDQFHLLSPAGDLEFLQSSEPLVSNDLKLDERQWAAVDCIGPLNAALRNWGGAILQPERLPAARKDAFLAIRRARTLGFADLDDLALYGTYALSVHPCFDFHRLVKERLRNRKPHDYFGALVADLGPKEWRVIAAESPPPEVALANKS